MKIIHTSDLHLGSKITAHLDPRRAEIRRRELQDGFARLVLQARELGASAIIIAGDLFDEESVSRRLIEATLATVAATPEITFFYLPGNHEGDAISSCATLIPENFKIFGKSWSEFSLFGVRILGRSELSEDMLRTIPSGGGRCVAVLHGELREGSSSGTVIGTSDIARAEIDYLALGHYHSYSARTIGKAEVVYSGTPEGRGFDEEGVRGFVLIDINERGTSHSFIPSEGRRMSIVEADITGDRSQSEIEATVGRALLGISRDDMVRVVLVGNHGHDTVRDTESICRRFSQSYFYFEVKDKSTLALNAEDYANDKSLLGEFVRKVMADNSLDPAERDRILECGMLALRGESRYGRS